MQTFPPTVILRHRKENLKKCSLRGLEGRDDMIFLTYPKSELPDLKKYILLTPHAPVLSVDDADMGLFLLDGTWRYAEVMHRWVASQVELVERSLPTGLETAYPRRQDEERGLASVEALYAAYKLTGRDPGGLLDGYHWRDAFLAKNPILE